MYYKHFGYIYCSRNFKPIMTTESTMLKIFYLKYKYVGHSIFNIFPQKKR